MANRSQACSSGEAGAADAALSVAMPPTAGLSPRARAQRQPPEDSGPPGEARGSSREGGPAKALAKLLPQKPETGVSSGGGNPGSAPGGRSSSLSKTGSLTPAPPALRRRDGCPGPRLLHGARTARGAPRGLARGLPAGASGTPWPAPRGRLRTRGLAAPSGAVSRRSMFLHRRGSAAAARFSAVARALLRDEPPGAGGGAFLALFLRWALRVTVTARRPLP